MEIRSCSICLFYFTESERTYSAAIPLPMVKYLLGQYLVFLSSTVNGYEGTGRSLSLKLVQKLQEQSHIYAKSTEGTGQQNNCESKTTNLRSQIRRKGNGPEDINQASDVRNPSPQSDLTKSPSHHETQLKASRDVAMATAAKAKLLLRGSFKADLAFAKGCICTCSRLCTLWWFNGFWVYVNRLHNRHSEYHFSHCCH
ncbi:uncharacterized protein [Cicer arietinum]|uniref:uncharacterized protein n=1 Tax=Cicer arietinum TaxID=3827 RepID=UPI00032A64D7